MRSVGIATPSHDGRVCLPFTQSLLADAEALRAEGTGVELLTEVGNPLIGLARARLVARFLAGSATDLIFIDADQGWEPGALPRLLAHPVDLVAGVVPSRQQEKGGAVTNFRPLAAAATDGLALDPETGLLEVEAVGTGFMRITRGALASLIAAFPETLFLDDKAPGGMAWALFDRLPGDDFAGEDYLFCKRWREIGGRVWVDPTLRLSHIGSVVYTDSLEGWLQGQGVPLREAA